MDSANDADNAADMDRSAAAFSELFAENVTPIWAYVRRRVGGFADADDVTAEVFTTAWRRRQDWPRKPSERRMWLFGIARNMVANHRRAAVRQQRLATRLSLAVPRGLAVEISERDDSLWAALDCLSPDDREVLMLRAWDQMAVGDIAVLMECSPNAVSMRLHKSRNRLRDVLGANTHEKESSGVGNEAPEPTRKEASR